MLFRKQNDICYRYLLWLVFSSLEKKKYDISNFEQHLLQKALKQCTIKKTYRLKSRCLYYEYISREEIYHSKVFQLVAKTNDVESLTDRFVFSGDSVPVPEALYNGQTIEQLRKDHGWNFYRIHFKCRAVRREPLYAGMKMPQIMDRNHTAKTFLSTGIYEPTQELIMKVRFDKDTIGLVKDVYFLTFNNYVDINPIAYEPLQIDYIHSCVTKRVRYPIYH